MDEKKPLIIFKDIIKTFSNKTILYNLNLEINEGEVIALIGKSGCGKSTLLKILLGLYPPEQGYIYFQNKDITKNYQKIRQLAGYVSQENSFYEKLSIEENLRFFAKLYKVKKNDINERIPILLSLVRLTNAKNTLASNISGGMKRRLEFAISLIHNPKILILDEPFTGLDIQIRNELWNVIKEIKTTGVTIIICSHLISSVEKHCDRAAILHNKKIIEEIDLTQNRDNLENKFLEVISR